MNVSTQQEMGTLSLHWQAQNLTNPPFALKKEKKDNAGIVIKVAHSRAERVRERERLRSKDCKTCEDPN